MARLETSTVPGSQDNAFSYCAQLMVSWAKGRAGEERERVVRGEVEC